MKKLQIGPIWLRKFVLTFALSLVVAMGPLNKLAAETVANRPAGPLDLTAAEEKYIAENRGVTVLAVGGAAPIQYTDENAEAQGVSKLVLDEIELLTELHFEFKLFDSFAELAAVANDGDIVMGVPAGFENVLPGLVLSNTYLKSYTVQYQHKSLDGNNLAGKRFAAVVGSNLPPGIPEEKAIYFDSREAAIEAVNEGQADYGYANTYSITYYTLKHRYRNLITVPIEREYREYCIAAINPDAQLLSILNKAIAALDADRLHEIILEASTNIDQDVTLGMFLESYQGLAWGIVLGIMALLHLWNFSRLFDLQRLRLQNQRYEMLATLTNEFFFTYTPQNDTLELGQRCQEYFSDCLDSVSEAIRSCLANSHGRCEAAATKTTLPPVACSVGVYRLVTGNIFDGDGNLQEIIGKLTDVTEEVVEKEALVTRAQIDGLTGVFNTTTVRDLVEKHMETRNQGSIDAFLLLDADFFKAINDNLGHYTGDQVLKSIASSLSSVFRSTDIIGRHGGDEFCVYVKGIPSADFILDRSKQLIAATSGTLEDIPVSVCVGIALVTNKLPYAEVFQAADAALYRAKAKGRGQVVIAE